MAILAQERIIRAIKKINPQDTVYGIVFGMERGEMLRRFLTHTNDLPVTDELKAELVANAEEFVDVLLLPSAIRYPIVAEEGTLEPEESKAPDILYEQDVRAAGPYSRTLHVCAVIRDGAKDDIAAAVRSVKGLTVRFELVAEASKADFLLIDPECEHYSAVYGRLAVVTKVHMTTLDAIREQLEEAFAGLLMLDGASKFLG